MPSEAQICFDAIMLAAVLISLSNSCLGRSTPSCLTDWILTPRSRSSSRNSSQATVSSVAKWLDCECLRNCVVYSTMYLGIISLQGVEGDSALKRFDRWRGSFHIQKQYATVGSTSQKLPKAPFAF